MAGNPAFFFLVVLEHREVDDPQRSPSFFKQTVRFAEFGMTDFQTQSAEGVENDLLAVGAKENDVAVLSTGSFDDGLEDIVGKVLNDRALETFSSGLDVINFDVGQPLGTVNLNEFGVAVDFAAGHGSAVRNAESHDAAVVEFGSGSEDLKVNVAHQIGEICEFELDAKVGLVGTVVVHCIRPQHDRERIGQVDIDGFFEDGADQLFHQGADFNFVQEAGFNIHLSEFRLTVSTKVFVTEAFNDLVVAVKACAHQHLFEELRRLRQSIEVAVVNTRGNQIVAGAFRSALGEHRSFDVDEAVLVKETAESHCSFVAELHIALHRQTTKVEHTISQTCGFGEIFVIKQEGGRCGRIQDLEFLSQHFNAAGDEVFVASAFRTSTNQAFNLHNEFVTDFIGSFEDVGTIRVADDLDQAFTIAQIDENNTAVVAAAMGPAVEGDSLTEEFLVNQTCIFSTH